MNVLPGLAEMACFGLTDSDYRATLRTIVHTRLSLCENLNLEELIALRGEIYRHPQPNNGWGDEITPMVTAVTLIAQRHDRQALLEDGNTLVAAWIRLLCEPIHHSNSGSEHGDKLDAFCVLQGLIETANNRFVRANPDFHFFFGQALVDVLKSQMQPVWLTPAQRCVASTDGAPRLARLLWEHAGRPPKAVEMENQLKKYAKEPSGRETIKYVARGIAPFVQPTSPGNQTESDFATWLQRALWEAYSSSLDGEQRAKMIASGP